MTESILETIKKMIGYLDSEYDIDIIVHINTFITYLNQLGIGKEGFIVNDASQTWEDFLGSEKDYFSPVKTYIYMKVRLAFDPPSSSYLISSMENTIREAEWRINEIYEAKRR